MVEVYGIKNSNAENNLKYYQLLSFTFCKICELMKKPQNILGLPGSQQDSCSPVPLVI